MDWLARITTAVALVLLPTACTDDGSTDASSGPSSSGSGSGSGSGSAGPTTTAPGPTTGVDDGTSTGRTTSSTGEDSTTGEVELCNGWSERGPDMPWLELYDTNHQPLASGGALVLECGGQGSWMFPIFPEMGGWELAEPNLTFSVEVVVEGFPGPFGSFYAEPNYYYGLECFNGGDTFDGGFAHDCIAVLPPDDIAALDGLDGAPATVHLELQVDGGEPLVVDLLDMTISAPADVVANGCAFG
jgi:hypothetical protein